MSFRNIIIGSMGRLASSFVQLGHTSSKLAWMLDMLGALAQPRQQGATAFGRRAHGGHTQHRRAALNRRNINRNRRAHKRA